MFASDYQVAPIDGTQKVSLMRFPIRFDSTYRALSKALLIAPSASYVDVDEDMVDVRMAWAFRSRFPRSAVTATRPHGGRPLSRGVHGLAGRWLVNGSGEGILEIKLEPNQRAHVLGFGVTLRELWLSVEDPSALAAALRSGPSQSAGQA